MASTDSSTTTTHPQVVLMPAEWAPHAACLMVLPHCGFTFRLKPARQQFYGIVRAIAQEGQEPVLIFCPTPELVEEVEQEFKHDNDNNNNNNNCGSMVRVVQCPSNDSWARDMGPTFVISDNRNVTTEKPKPHLVGLDWKFNAWGGPEEGCYWPCDQDQKAAALMCNTLQKLKPLLFQDKWCLLSSKQIDMILEGGSIHVDGQGTLLTTKECLLNKNRNPNLTQDQIESVLKQELGVSKILWLPHGVDGDEDTNGHIDNFACFARCGEIVLSWTDDSVHDKVNYDRCRVALQLLQQETDAQGRALTIHKLPLPPPIFYTEEEVQSLDLYQGKLPRQVGERMAASYVNFYIANAAVIVPQFGGHCVEADARALETLRDIFPDRKVVGVPSKEILIGGGNIHCITQQVPQIS